MSQISYLSYAHSEGIMNALGLNVVTVQPNEELKTLIERLRRQGDQVIYLSEAVYEKNQALIRDYDQNFDVAISILPNELGQQSAGLKRLNQLVTEAVGVTMREEENR